MAKVQVDKLRGRQKSDKLETKCRCLSKVRNPVFDSGRALNVFVYCFCLYNMFRKK